MKEEKSTFILHVCCVVASCLCKPASAVLLCHFHLQQTQSISLMVSYCENRDTRSRVVKSLTDPPSTELTLVSPPPMPTLAPPVLFAPLSLNHTITIVAGHPCTLVTDPLLLALTEQVTALEHLLVVQVSLTALLPPASQALLHAASQAGQAQAGQNKNGRPHISPSVLVH